MRAGMFLFRFFECGNRSVVVGFAGHFLHDLRVTHDPFGIEHKDSAGKDLEFFNEQTPVLAETAVHLVAAAPQRLNIFCAAEAVHCKG